MTVNDNPNNLPDDVLLSNFDVTITALMALREDMTRMHASEFKVRQVTELIDSVKKFRGRNRQSNGQLFTLERVVSIDSFSYEEKISAYKLENKDLSKRADLATREASVWKQAFMAIVENPAVDKARVTE